MHRPRRIFRSGSLRSGGSSRRFSPTVVGGLIGAVLGSAIMLLSLPSALFGRVPLPSGTVEADAPEVAVIDGQTLRLRETVIRLLGVVAPSRGQACRTQGGTAFDCGAAATEGLAALVRGHAVTCHLAGRDAAGFPEAQCESGGIVLNRAVIAAGWGRADAPELVDDESAARDRHLGLWRDGVAAPTF